MIIRSALQDAEDSGQTKDWIKVISLILHKLNPLIYENNETQGNEENKHKEPRKQKELIPQIFQSLEWRNDKIVLNNFWNIWFDLFSEIEDIKFEISCDGYSNRFRFISSNIF